MADCRHCGLDVPADSPGGDTFCCPGCKAAYDLVRGLGLERYYKQRSIDPGEAALRPDADDAPRNYCAYVRENDDGLAVLHLMVGGLHCAACVWLIENVLMRCKGVVSARLNMTTRRLVISWRKDEVSADDLVSKISALGYRLAPYDPAKLEQESTERQNLLLRAMAVAGFAAGNVMLLSVSVWSGSGDDMGPSTRSLLHWLSALIALPATAYAGQHFFRSASGVLRQGRMNMDVPISLALVLTAGMSLFETIRETEHVYFDSVLTLLFFLLVGRYLDLRARGRARAVGEHPVGPLPDRPAIGHNRRGIRVQHFSLPNACASENVFWSAAIHRRFPRCSRRRWLRQESAFLGSPRVDRTVQYRHRSIGDPSCNCQPARCFGSGHSRSSRRARQDRTFTISPWRGKGTCVWRFT